jgi:hypothetical protein
VQAGKTVIERNSEDFSVIAQDPERYRTMYKKVQDAFDSKTQYFIDRVSTSHAIGEMSSSICRVSLNVYERFYCPKATACSGSYKYCFVKS